jgi:hypothetical protein
VEGGPKARRMRAMRRWLFGLGLGIVLGIVACGSSGDDTNCTNNHGTCTTAKCGTSTLPYSCGSGGVCCLIVDGG